MGGGWLVQCGSQCCHACLCALMHLHAIHHGLLHTWSPKLHIIFELVYTIRLTSALDCEDPFSYVFHQMQSVGTESMTSHTSAACVRASVSLGSTWVSPRVELFHAYHSRHWGQVAAIGGCDQPLLSSGNHREASPEWCWAGTDCPAS